VTLTAAPTRSTVLVNGERVAFHAYNIGGHNYFKLRNVAAAIDFAVTWNSATGTIGIDTSAGYRAIAWQQLSR